MYCKNYIVCTNITESADICLECEMLFGRWRGNKGSLEIKENEICPVCLKINTCISRPNCDHFVCVECFKILFFESPNLSQEGDELYNYLEYINRSKKCDCKLKG